LDRLPPIPNTHGQAREGFFSPRACLFLNALVLPGLGSLCAKRWVPGAAQMILAFLGFFLCAGALVLFYSRMLSDENFNADPKSILIPGGVGLLLFVISWIWAVMTGLNALRSRKN
jgi:hypothetical protein